MNPVTIKYIIEIDDDPIEVKIISDRRTDKKVKTISVKIFTNADALPTKKRSKSMGCCGATK